eukprot:TRINITY_DN2061_c0_g1_i1.p1 TRINITY_DN2061_c0_g1~~TRINITY_DN2061_c0_g1_i1.p1  ORF type:complete len:303 (+),score=65.01 TRINITY_DN2061_c0_g1_i1:72-980(+)
MSDPADVSPALPYPKYVILFADGVCRSPSSSSSSSSLLESSEIKNLDKLAKEGCSGLLMFRKDVSSSSEAREMVEFAQLVNLYDEFICQSQNSEHKISYQKKNFNLRTHLMSNSSQIFSFASNSDFFASTKLPTHIKDINVDELSSQISSILDLKSTGSAASDKAENVFIHITSSGNSDVDVLSMTDKLAGILRNDWPDLFLVVVAGYGDNKNVLVKLLEPEVDDRIKSIIPTQSYIIQCSSAREESPLYVVYYHPNFSRKDNVQCFTENEIIKNNGNGKMLADAFIPEVAFKQGKMPKYGA